MQNEETLCLTSSSFFHPALPRHERQQLYADILREKMTVMTPGLVKDELEKKGMTFQVCFPPWFPHFFRFLLLLNDMAVCRSGHGCDASHAVCGNPGSRYALIDVVFILFSCSSCVQANIDGRAATLETAWL